MARIIGLVGHIGAGKSAVARILSDQQGFVRFKFAYHLKNMLQALGLTPREIEGDLKEQPCAILGGRTPRHAMITLGTEWGRNMLDPDLWVRAALRDVDGWAATSATSFVFDDVRFPNEADAILKRGGLIWRVIRPNSASMYAGHESEEGQSAIRASRVICNDGTLAELQREVLGV